MQKLKTVLMGLGAYLLLAPPLSSEDCIILLHGLSRTKSSMFKMSDSLNDAGFKTVNQGYPSRKERIEALSEGAMQAALPQCKGAERIGFVTHSMGGILVRDYYARHPDAQRPYAVVMLAPPNHGSQIIDNPTYETLGSWWNGPAGEQLSAKPSSFVNQLPPVDYPTGVIAGNRSIELYNSDILPGDDDGKVSVSSTAVDGMTDWLAMPVNHTFIMQNDNVIEQVIRFFRFGEFNKR